MQRSDVLGMLQSVQGCHTLWGRLGVVPKQQLHTSLNPVQSLMMCGCSVHAGQSPVLQLGSLLDLVMEHNSRLVT